MEHEYENQDTDNQELEGHEGEEQPEGEGLGDAYDAPIEIEASEHQEEEKAEAAPLKKKKVNIGERLSQVQREKYQALDELKAIKEENERLRALADTSTQTALNHYDQAVQQRFHAAKEQKIKALEAGDIVAQTEADIALSMATAEYQNLNNMKAQQEVYQQNQYQQQPAAAPTYEREVHDWATRNDWFHPASESYDEEMANEVHAYCNAFDANLYRHGKGHMINSRDYLDLVDEHVRIVKANKNQSSRGRDLQMKSGRGTVAPRGGHSGHSNGNAASRQPQLTSDEKDMARRLGISDDAYLTSRKRDESENGHRRVRR